ncbi:MAG: OmpH family outer membrane protein [Bdellovibrionota bacterium]
MKSKLLLILGLLFLLPAFALAEFKIVTVDVNAVLNESKGSIKQKQDLDKLSKDARVKVTQKKEEIKKLEQTLASKKVSPDSPEAEDFRNKARDYSRYVKDTEEELKKKFLAINKELTDKVLKQIEIYAKANKVDLVLDKGSNDRPSPVLFGNPGADITKEIIKKMNS